MNEFLGWFLETVGSVDPVLRIGLAGLAIMLETSVLIGLVIPGDFIVLVASTGTADTAQYIWLLVVVIVGSLVGETIGYFLGHYFGPAIQHSRVGRWIGHKNWTAADRFLDHRGGWAVFISRFLPVLHSLVPLTAGIIGMKYSRFMAWTTPACVLWASAYITVGRSAAQSFEALADTLHFAGYLFVGIIVVFIAIMTLVKKALDKYMHRSNASEQ
jgi:membrane protein DedA with SNARE-associated domain